MEGIKHYGSIKENDVSGTENVNLSVEEPPTSVFAFKSKLATTFAVIMLTFCVCVYSGQNYSSVLNLSFSDQSSVEHSMSDSKHHELNVEMSIEAPTGQCTYSTYANQYLNGYDGSLGTYQFSTLVAAQTACSSSTKCGGITYEPYSKMYTMRAGTTPYSSPSGETSYLKGACSLALPPANPSQLPSAIPSAEPSAVSSSGLCTYTTYTNQYLNGYDASLGTYTFATLAAAQTACSSSTKCGGITYEPDSNMYTMRAAPTPNSSTKGEISYLKGACSSSSLVVPVPSALPSALPSEEPSEIPSAKPSAKPSAMPSTVPSTVPSAIPSTVPSTIPSEMPSTVPSALPSEEPSSLPSAKPSAVPSAIPSAIPSAVPSTIPSEEPSAKPSRVPSKLPSAVPSTVPSAEPSAISSSVHCPYGTYANQYLGGYDASLGTFQYPTLAAAETACSASAQCGGITYEPYSEMYTMRAGTTPYSSPSGETSYLKGDCSSSSLLGPSAPPSSSGSSSGQCTYTTYANQYLGGYDASLGTFQFPTLAAAETACSASAQCGGITYEPYSKMYTMRAGTTPYSSPSGETSYLKGDCSSSSLLGPSAPPSSSGSSSGHCPYGTYANQYLGGYDASLGTFQYPTLAAAETACSASAQCGGITYEPYSEMYTMRAGTTPYSSPSGETSYLKGACSSSSLVVPVPSADDDEASDYNSSDIPTCFDCGSVDGSGIILTYETEAACKTTCPAHSALSSSSSAHCAQSTQNYWYQCTLRFDGSGVTTDKPEFGWIVEAYFGVTTTDANTKCNTQCEQQFSATPTLEGRAIVSWTCTPTCESSLAASFSE